MSKSLITVAAIFVSHAVFLSGAVHAVTLEEALVQAYDNNPTLSAQRANMRAIDEQVPQALSNWRPTISATGSAGVAAYRNYRLSSTTARQHRDPRSVAVSITQPLYRGGRTLAATSKAENTVQAERARLVNIEQTTLLSAATAYVNLVREEAVLELNVKNEQVLRRQWEATKDRFEVGEITRTDVHQALARLARATADRIQAEGNLESSRATYLNVIGKAPGKLSNPALTGSLPGTLGQVTELAADNNPVVVGAIFDERASRDNADEIMGSLLPTVSLSGSAAHYLDTGGENTHTANYEGKVTVSVPLYQSGSVYSKLRQARQLVAQRRMSTEQQRQNAIEKGTRAWRLLETTRARVVSFKTQIEAAAVALEGVQREADVGSRTLLDVLNAEQELLDAKVNLIGARRDLLLAGFQLKEAVGDLTAEKLNLPVDLYDPTVHYQEVRTKWFGGRSSGDADAGGDAESRGK